MNQMISENDLTLKERKQHGTSGYPVGTYLLTFNKYHIPYVRWHWHEELEMVSVIEGAVELYIGNEVLLLNTGEIIIINQNVLHSFRSIPEITSKLEVVVFDPMYIFNNTTDNISRTYFLKIEDFKNFRKTIIFPYTPDNKKLAEYITNIIKMNREKTFGYELLTKADLCHIWLIILLNSSIYHHQQTLVPALSHDEERVKTAITFIEEHHNEQLSLEDIANSINVSKSECCRCFKKILKTTPFQYLIRYRIFNSTRFIQNGVANNMTIAELAASVGFNNTSYFNKLFRELMHCSPTEYRRQVANGTQSEYHNYYGFPLTGSGK